MKNNERKLRLLKALKVLLWGMVFYLIFQNWDFLKGVLLDSIYLIFG
ncbi:MAG: hypothetical protein R6U46_11270 [Marinilabilia sp.]